MWRQGKPHSGSSKAQAAEETLAAAALDHFARASDETVSAVVSGTYAGGVSARKATAVVLTQVLTERGGRRKYTRHQLPSCSAVVGVKQMATSQPDLFTVEGGSAPADWVRFLALR